MIEGPRLRSSASSAVKNGFISEREEMTEADERLNQLLDLVRQQETFLEMFARSWCDDYRTRGGSVFCGKGCSNCCSLPVHTGFIEALAVARKLGEEGGGKVDAYAIRLGEWLRGVTELGAYLRLHRREMGFCPLLDGEGSCGVYPVRPLTCRSLISTLESRWCGVNLAQLPPEERNLFLAGLDRAVVAFPTQYVAVLRESGRELEDSGAERMRKLLGFSLYGNLGLLVHLIRRHRLVEVCLKGVDATADAIAGAGFAHPLLVTITRGG